MTGVKLADITGGLAAPPGYGTYDDISGAFNATLNVSGPAGPTVTLTGNLIFDGSGFLNPNSTLSIDFDNSDGFLAGDVCCNGTGDPNSFKDIAGVMTMSLWGANWSYDGGGEFDGDLLSPYDGSTLGMDLRMSLAIDPSSVVPVQPAVWLFGSGLLGLVGIARRRS